MAKDIRMSNEQPQPPTPQDVEAAAWQEWIVRQPPAIDYDLRQAFHAGYLAALAQARREARADTERVDLNQLIDPLLKGGPEESCIEVKFRRWQGSYYCVIDVEHDPVDGDSDEFEGCDYDPLSSFMVAKQHYDEAIDRARDAEKEEVEGG